MGVAYNMPTTCPIKNGGGIKDKGLRPSAAKKEQLGSSFFGQAQIGGGYRWEPGRYIAAGEHNLFRWSTLLPHLDHVVPIALGHMPHLTVQILPWHDVDGGTKAFP